MRIETNFLLRPEGPLSLENISEHLNPIFFSINTLITEIVYML